MPTDSFRFKQFRVRHDSCAMKVGTDGVLLGAWGSVEGRRILDIGTGTGLIALMAAQRNPDAAVVGIDVSEAAIRQARQNVAESPFSHRVSCLLEDVLTFRPGTPFDSILCNPPFFTEDTLPGNKARALARNNSSLPFSRLIPKVAALLSEGGRFSVIVPHSHAQEIVGLCLADGMRLLRRCEVRTVAYKPPRRTLLTFAERHSGLSPDSLPPETGTSLCLTAADGSRSAEYRALTDAFYL